MKINVDAIVMDYDRTVADEGLGFKIREAVKKELRRPRRPRLILATGRRLEDIPDKEVVKIFHAIVVENGTILFINEGRTKTILVDDEWFPKKKRLIKIFLERGLNFHSGEVIFAGYKKDVKKVKRILREIGMDNEVSLEFNREGLMILPAGWNKGRGTEIALKRLGGGRLMAIGDDFNDFSLFEVADIKVAVKNAVPELKKEADIVCERKEGKGVLEIMSKIA